MKALAASFVVYHLAASSHHSQLRSIIPNRLAWDFYRIIDDKWPTNLGANKDMGSHCGPKYQSANIECSMIFFVQGTAASSHDAKDA